MSSLNSRKIWQETMKKWNTFHLENKKQEIQKTKIDKQEIVEFAQRRKRWIAKGKDVLLLFSGGIGSTTALYQLMKMKRKPIILYVEGIENERLEKEQKKILVRMALECRCETGKPLISIVSNTSTTNSSNPTSPRIISWFQSICVRSESQKSSVYERFLEEGGNKDFFPFFKLLYLQTVLDACYENIPKEKKPQIVWGNLFHVQDFIHSMWEYISVPNTILERNSISTKESIPFNQGSILSQPSSFSNKDCIEYGGFSTQTFDHFILFSNPFDILKKLFEAEKISDILRLDYRIKVSDIAPTTILPLYVSNLISSCGSERKFSDPLINNNNNNNNNIPKKSISSIQHEEEEKIQRWKTFPFLNHCWKCMDCMWWKKEIEKWIEETEKDKKKDLPIFGEGHADKRDFVYSFRNLPYKENNSIPSLIDLQKTEVFWSKVKKREWILFTKTRGRKKKTPIPQQTLSKNDPTVSNNRPRFQLLSSTRLSTNNSISSLTHQSNHPYDEMKNSSESILDNKEKVISNDNEHSISLFNSLNFDTIDYDEDNDIISSEDEDESEEEEKEENEDTEKESEESDNDKKKKKRKPKQSNHSNSSSDPSNSEDEDYDSDHSQLKKINPDDKEEFIEEEFNDLEDTHDSILSEDSYEFNEDD